MYRLTLAAVLAVFLATPSWTGGAQAKEFILTAIKPDKLVMVDAAARKVARTYTVPNASPGVLTITPSPDGKIAYVLINRWESVSGIDLDTGKEVFRADFSAGDIRTKGMFGVTISPDGKEIFVFQSPVRLLPGEFEVLDTRVAVYNTGDGIGAKPVRTFPAPRRTAILTNSADGTKLYAVNWDITIMDSQTGKVLGTHKVRNWGRENHSEPDVLDVWPQWEQASVFSTPYYAVRTDVAMDHPEAFQTGMLTLDLKSGEFVMENFEPTAAIIFSTVVNPVRRNEVYGVYTTLSKIDLETDKLVNRIDLDHTYYTVNVSGDGKEIYVGGTMDDIAVYDSGTLEKIGEIRMPGGGDQALASLRVIQR
jgi:quinohemoprotein amine dehydrogenase beta subunit